MILKKKMMSLPNRALTNIDLYYYARKMKIPHFRGVFMQDTLPKRAKKFETAIVNLNSSNERGSHWVAYKKDDDTVYYFDSFGNLPPPSEILKYMKNCNFKYNYDNFQSINSYNCGHLCLKFLCKK